MKGDRGRLFTIGHGRLELHQFVALLARFGIAVVADIRSAPYSRYMAQYNKPQLAPFLARAGFEYRYLGADLGGKPQGDQWRDPAGRVDYQRLRQSAMVQTAIDALLRQVEAGRERLVLFCAEEDPRHCHRHHLLARELTCRRGIEVWHIRQSGVLERATGFDARPQLRPRQQRLF